MDRRQPSPSRSDLNVRQRRYGSPADAGAIDRIVDPVDTSERIRDKIAASKRKGLWVAAPYRYYVSRPGLHGEARTADLGSVSRVPADDIEKTAMSALRKHLADQNPEGGNRKEPV